MTRRLDTTAAVLEGVPHGNLEVAVVALVVNLVIQVELVVASVEDLADGNEHLDRISL